MICLFIKIDIINEIQVILPFFEFLRWNAGLDLDFLSFY